VKEVHEMTFAKLFRLGGSAGIASGILFVLSALVLFAGIFASSIPDIVFITLVLFSNVLIVFTIMALYGVQIKETGNEGVAGFALSMIGLLLDLADFFSPLGSVLFVIGLALLAAANMRTGRLPILAMWLWVAVAVLSLIFVILGWRLLIGLVLIFSGAIRIWLGTALRSITVEEF
jgi:hypothetical protein